MLVAPLSNLIGDWQHTETSYLFTGPQQQIARAAADRYSIIFALGSSTTAVNISTLAALVTGAGWLIPTGTGLIQLTFQDSPLLVQKDWYGVGSGKLIVHEIFFRPQGGA